MNDRSQKLRSFYASFVAGGAHPRVQQAFAAVPREPFVGPGPWSVMGSSISYVTTPDDDPVFIYQDVLVALDASRGLNIGMPSAHAVWLAAVDLKAGETVLQVGVGSGYYSAIIAELVGREGRVHAYEIDRDLAARATDNLGTGRRSMFGPHRALLTICRRPMRSMSVLASRNPVGRGSMRCARVVACCFRCSRGAGLAAC